VSKPTYFVDVIYPGRETDYRDFWERGVKCNGAGETLTADLVAFSARIKASNRREAMVLVRAQYPNHKVAARVTRYAGKNRRFA